MSEKQLKALYSIILEDDTKFVGGTSYFKTKWRDIPNKKIKRVFCRLPGGDYITLSGYDKYYYMVEVTKDWAKIIKKTKKIKKLNHNIPRLEAFYVMGKKDSLIVSYRISLKTSKSQNQYKFGNITKTVFKYNDPFIKGLNPMGWK